MNADPSDRQSDLAALRARIDEIDAEMHRLLIRRGEVIDRLVAAKSTQESGVAFRPGREVSMLRRLAERHEGGLPLSTVEHVWREIIGTFTQAQAAFRVHAPHAETPAVRDSLRFHFGFAATIVGHASASEAVQAAADSGVDLAFVPIGDAPGEAWWRPLEQPGSGIKVVAALPLLVPASQLRVAPGLIVGSSAIETDDAPFGVYATEGDASAPGLHVLARGDAGALVAYGDGGALDDLAAGDGMPAFIAGAHPVGRLHALPLVRPFHAE